MLTITKRFEFSYGHRLVGYKGPCAEMHGHNALMEITVRGGPVHNTYTAKEKTWWELAKKMSYDNMVIDFKLLKHIVEEEVLDYLDHKDLTAFFTQGPPTAELMTAWVWRELERVFGGNLISVKMSETRDSWCEITRSDRTESTVLALAGRRE